MAVDADTSTVLDAHDSSLDAPLVFFLRCETEQAERPTQMSPTRALPASNGAETGPAPASSSRVFSVLPLIQIT
jgi:hypothetical protein